MPTSLYHHQESAMQCPSYGKFQSLQKNQTHRRWINNNRLFQYPDTAGPRGAAASDCALWQQIGNAPGAKILSNLNRKCCHRIWSHQESYLLVWITRVHYHHRSQTLGANLLNVLKRAATKNLETQAQKPGLQLHPSVRTRRWRNFGRLPLQTHQQHSQRDQHPGTGDRKLHWGHHADLPAYLLFHENNTAGESQWPTDASAVTIHHERIPH